MKYITKKNGQTKQSLIVCKNLLSKNEQKKIWGGVTFTCTGEQGRLFCSPFTGACMTVTTDNGNIYTCDKDSNLKKVEKIC